ncbi:MAG: hypothetical protein ABIH92_00790 [Nanoarchaeota archaeon]
MFTKRIAFSSTGRKRKVSAPALQEKFLSITDRTRLNKNQVLPFLLYWSGRRDCIGVLRGASRMAVQESIVDEEVRKTMELVPILDAIGTPYHVELSVTELTPNVFDLSSVEEVGRYGELDRDDDVSRGLNFHYPRCCIDAWVADEAAGREKFPRFEAMRRKHNIETAYVLHIPCSSGCEPTLVQAREYMEFTRRNFPRLAEYLERNRFGE